MSDLTQPQLQRHLQAKAQAQIQAFQALVQQQAQAYALAQIQPQVQALAHQMQLQTPKLPQLPQQQAANGTQQQGQPPPASGSQVKQITALAQMQAAQMKAMSQASAGAAQRGASPIGQRIGQQAAVPSSEMQRQLREQMIGQVWAQAHVKQHREMGVGVQQQVVQQLPQVPLTSRSRQTLIRQASSQIGMRSPTRSPSAQVASPSSAISQRTEVVLQEPPVVPQSQLAFSTRRNSLENLGEPTMVIVPESAESDQELLPGVKVNVDGSWFEIMQPLGMGSYGMVWSALSEASIEVAVKEILCRTEGELGIAHFEGRLLHRLGQMERGACRNGRLPALVAQETAQIQSNNTWRVRLAMSRIPGMPLMILIEQHREQKAAKGTNTSAGENGEVAASSPEQQETQQQAEAPAPQLRAPGETSLQMLTRRLWEPCLYTKELIVQIFPTLERISAVAFHRDINPRNILIDSPNGAGRPNYGLVDFGMAVDAAQWRSNVDGNWNTLEVGGDCRYWPISAWVMFLHGPELLTHGDPWRVEYQTQLDIHALGITALQVFVEMLPDMSELAAGEDDDDGCLRGEDSLLAQLKILADAWSQYWEDAMDFWGCLIDCFTNGGNWNELKRACIQHGVQEAITRDLADLRAALSASASACELVANSNSSLPGRAVETARELQTVFRAVRALISVGDTTEFPAWRNIHSILGLPASLLDIGSSHRFGLGSGVRGASARFVDGGTSARFVEGSRSTDKLHSSRFTSGRSCKFEPSSNSAPGPLIARGVSATHDASNVKSSPVAAQRQASVVRNMAPSGPSTRFINSSPITSPRRAQVLDPLGPRVGSTGQLQKPSAREQYTGRRSSANIITSPPGPARRGGAEELLSARGKSAIVPPNANFSQTVGDFSSLRAQEPPINPMFTATAPPNSIIRATSSVFRGASNGYTTARLPESNSSPMILGLSVVAAAAPGNTELVNGLAKSTAGMQPEFSPVLRGSSVTTSSARLQRSASPVRGSSVVVETSAARGASLVTTAGRTASMEAPQPVRNSSYVAESGTSGPTPPQEVRMAMASSSILSARQPPSVMDPGAAFLLPGQWSAPLFPPR